MKIEDWMSVKQSLDNVLTTELECKSFVEHWARAKGGIAVKMDSTGVVLFMKDMLPRVMSTWKGMFWQAIFIDFMDKRLAFSTADELRVWYDLNCVE